MCGIAGYFLPEGQAEQALVQAMCDQIVHRGPDDHGYHVDGGCAIGMRRLSIIDLSTGHQPMSNEDGTIWVVFNGEIYDYQQLREDLAAKGHQFRTRSDTEVLVHLYEEEGPAGIERLRGMFGFAIWDSRRKQLLLARDRFGKKPFYYAVLPQGIYFASELKCLRPARLPLDLDEDALKLYLQFRYIPDPRSPFQQVKKLEPGGWLRYDASGKVETGRYWKLPEPAGAEPAPGMDEGEMKRQLRDLFDESVRIRMMADVPLGAFLSGGVDSTAVVASMAVQSSQPVKTFSIGFEEAEFNELEYASIVAKRYATDHHEIMVKPESIALMPRLVQHFDEPFGDSSAIPTLIVSEFARKTVTVVLSGDGGDEMFGGYPSFQAAARLQRWDRLGPLRGLVGAAAKALPYRAYGKNFLYMISRETAMERYFEWNYLPNSLLENVLQPRWLRPSRPEYFQKMFGERMLGKGVDPVVQTMYFESTANLTGDMLVKVDRMSMAASIEVRSPMLDHKLAEFAARIPYGWKMRGGLGKAFFIEAFSDRLPEATWKRAKRGFSVPIAQWFRGPLRPFLWDHLTSRRFLDLGFVREPFLRHLLEEHDSGRRNNRTILWNLLMLDLWLEQWRADLTGTPSLNQAS